jgi:hypothetical protein
MCEGTKCSRLEPVDGDHLQKEWSEESKRITRRQDGPKLGRQKNSSHTISCNTRLRVVVGTYNKAKGNQRHLRRYSNLNLLRTDQDAPSSLSHIHPLCPKYKQFSSSLQVNLLRLVLLLSMLTAHKPRVQKIGLTRCQTQRFRTSGAKHPSRLRILFAKSLVAPMTTWCGKAAYSSHRTSLKLTHFP